MKKLFLTFTITILLQLAISAKAQTDYQRDTSSKLRISLANAKTPRDSIKILYDIFDVVPRNQEVAIGRQIYDIAKRIGDNSTRLDICRQLTACFRDDRSLAEIEKEVSLIPESQEQKETHLFLRMKRLSYSSSNKSETDRQKEIIRILAEEDKGKTKSPTQRLLDLFTLVEFLRNDASGDMLKEYLDRLIMLVTSYLRLIASDNDDMSFSRIINLPARKFGNASLANLRTMAEQHKVSLMTMLRSAVDTPKFNRPQFREFISLIDTLRTLSTQIPVSELTDKLLVDSRLADLYRMDEREDRLENIAELINSMKEYELSHDEDDDRLLDAYLQEIALYTNVDAANDKDKVRLMTIHQSKGLEFPTVFITGLTEGVFPNHRSIRERRKDGEEEERRLMYVAVTRARKMLYLSESEGYMNDNGALRYPSRFISEIPEVLLTIEGKPDPALFEGTRNMVNMLNSELGEGDESPMSPGTAVEHKIFGTGVIVSFDPAARSYRVRFQNTERDLVPRVLRKI